MKKLAYLIFTAITCVVSHSYAYDFGRDSTSEILVKDITSEIPDIGLPSGFQKIPNAAQYKEADWSGAIGIAHEISLNEAYKIAAENPDINFFFYMKGGQMVLEKTDGTYRMFRHGDAVFFTGEPWWGSAPGLSDGYIKTLEKN